MLPQKRITPTLALLGRCTRLSPEEIPNMVPGLEVPSKNIQETVVEIRGPSARNPPYLVASPNKPLENGSFTNSRRTSNSHLDSPHQQPVSPTEHKLVLQRCPAIFASCRPCSEPAA